MEVKLFSFILNWKFQQIFFYSLFLITFQCQYDIDLSRVSYLMRVGRPNIVATKANYLTPNFLNKKDISLGLMIKQMWEAIFYL